MYEIAKLQCRPVQKHQELTAFEKTSSGYPSEISAQTKKESPAAESLNNFSCVAK